MMDIRSFQIIVPLVALFFIIGLLSRYRKKTATFGETTIGSLFWVMVILLALFPDFFSNKLALLLDIEDNVNALLFFGLGLLFFFQFKLYFKMKKQEQDLTQLTRKLALKEQFDAQK